MAVTATILSGSRAGLGSVAIGSSPPGAYVISNVGVVAGSAAVAGVANMDGVASVIAVGRSAVSGAAQMDGQGQMVASRINAVTGAAHMDGQAQMSGTIGARAVGVAHMDGQALVAVLSSGAVVQSVANMDGQGQMVAISIDGAGIANMDGSASVFVASTVGHVTILQEQINLSHAVNIRERVVQVLSSAIRLVDTPAVHSSYNYNLITSFSVQPSFIDAWNATFSLVQGLVINQTSSQKLIWGRVLKDILRISGTAGLGGLYKKVLTQLLRLSEVEGLRLSHPVTLGDAVSVSLSLAAKSSLKLLQKLLVATSASPLFTYHTALAGRIVIEGFLDHFAHAILAQLFNIQPAVDRQFIANNSLAQLLSVSSALTNKLVLHIVETGVIQLNMDQLVEMIYKGDPLLDGVVITALYVSPSGTTTTWAVNTRTSAISEYMNYGFSSFTQMGNRYIAAGREGLYELDGDTDDGVAIIADLMSGYLQLNNKKLFGIKGAYVAIRGGGRFYLKLIAGDGREYVYELKAQPNMMTTKVKIGKGIRTTYMAFELITEGQDFDLDSLEFIPMTSGRRV